MGGSGSGNFYHWWRSSKKATVEDCLSLDANRWMREGILKAGLERWGSWRWTYHSGSSFSLNYEVQTLDMDNPRVRLSYKWTFDGQGEVQSAEYDIRLTTTCPQFGGLRLWFICPLLINDRACNRRVGKLYLPGRAHYFGCRHCYDLTYTSCQESRKYDGLARFFARNLDTDLATAKVLLRDFDKRHR
jgi:hypothetical protein